MCDGLFEKVRSNKPAPFMEQYLPSFSDCFLTFFFFYSRNHIKGHSKPEEVPPPLVLGSLVEGLSSPLSPQHLQMSGKPTGITNNALTFTGLKDTSPNGNLSRTAWAKWVTVIHYSSKNIKDCFFRITKYIRSACLAGGAATKTWGGEERRNKPWLVHQLYYERVFRSKLFSVVGLWTEF